ncbi:MAG: hypothetical protein ACMG5Z_03720 [Luteimonas sp.]
MTAVWDRFQREALTALGHVVYQAADSPVDAHASQRVAADDGAPPLLQALARAAGVPVERLAGLPPLDRLRTPAAKRTLWPRLRAMRAASRS